MDAYTTDRLPYTSPDRVLEIIRRRREKGWKEDVTKESLMRTGFSPANAYRTVAGLHALGLIDEQGRQTPAFDRLGKASTEEYPAVLAEIVKAVYRSVLVTVDPATDDERKLEDAFRNYEPEAQRQRMVHLFLALCVEAEMAPPPTRASRSASSRVRELRRAPERGTSLKPSTGVPTTGLPPANHDAEIQPQAPGGIPAPADHPMLRGLMAELPPLKTTWAADSRATWLAALEAILNVLFPPEPVPHPEPAAHWSVQRSSDTHAPPPWADTGQPEDTRSESRVMP